MKRKVALIATLLSLILCVAFLFIVGGAARDTLNSTTFETMTRICRLSVVSADSAAFTQEEKDAFLRDTGAQTNSVLSLYDREGKVLFINRPSYEEALTESEIQSIIDNKTFSFTRERSDGKGVWRFVGGVTKDAEIIVVSGPEYTVFDALGAKKGQLFLLAFVCTLLCALIFTSARKKSDELLNSVEKVLTDFTEGEFDSRISGNVGDSMEQVAHFNEVIGRLQERVLKQYTRNEAFSAIFNHTKNGFLAVDDQMRVLLINSPAKQYLGIMGRCEGETLKECSRDQKLEHVFAEAMKQQNIYTSEIATKSVAGRGHRPIRMYISPMMEENNVTGAVAIVEDITELRRLEEMRVDFVANVSHELKTPLTSIRGFVETLENGALEHPEMAKKFLKIISVEVERLTRLITDILSISKMESGTDEIPDDKVSFSHEVDYVCEMLRMHAKERGISIHLSMDENEELYVMGNKDRVRQIIINLVENAIKYNKDGGDVNVSLSASENSVNLAVADTGIGIAEENIPRLFERFYRVDKGRSRAMGGTGLGLAIVKHIVKLMNGMIEVHSKLGEGTEFLITIPRTTPPVSQEEAAEIAE